MASLPTEPVCVPLLTAQEKKNAALFVTWLLLKHSLTPPIQAGVLQWLCNMQWKNKHLTQSNNKSKPKDSDETCHLLNWEFFKHRNMSESAKKQ